MISFSLSLSKILLKYLCQCFLTELQYNINRICYKLTAFETKIVPSVTTMCPLLLIVNSILSNLQVR